MWPKKITNLITDLIVRAGFTNKAAFGSFPWNGSVNPAVGKVFRKVFRSNNLFYNLFWYFWDKGFCNFPSFDWSETAAECSSLSCISLVLPHQQFQDLFVWNRRKICCSIKPVLLCDFGWDGIFYWVWRCRRKEFF